MPKEIMVPIATLRNDEVKLCDRYDYDFINWYGWGSFMPIVKMKQIKADRKALYQIMPN